MKQKVLLFFLLFVFARSFSQGPVRINDHAPNFVLTLEGNSIQSYVFPYVKHLVLLHFWSSEVITSRNYGKHLNTLTKRYENAIYKNAEGFSVIDIAVQNNKKTWRDALKADSLTEFTHGIALKGFDEDVCKKYGVTSLPTDVLIDENGTVIAIDPKLVQVEEILDERKNFQPVKKDVTGTLALASNKAEVFKYSRLYLFNHYGDSIGKTTTNGKGIFTFSNIKLNQDFILKMDNQGDIITSDPISLYTPTGELLMQGVTSEGGMIFYIPARLSLKLTEPVAGEAHINIIKNLDFTASGTGLTPKDEKELAPILNLLQDGTSRLEYTTNTDSKLDDASAAMLTSKQAETLALFFMKKGIDKSRLKGISKGNTEPRVICDSKHPCTDEDEKENRRVEFFVHKN